MASEDSAALADQLANLQTQLLSLERQNTNLVRKNVALAEELDSTKGELRETQALLGQAVVKASRQLQTVSTSRSPAAVEQQVASSSRLKRPRSSTSESTMEQAALGAPPSKKGKERMCSSKSAVDSGSSLSSSATPQPASAGKIKESPGKPVKIEFAQALEVITIDDDSDSPSEPEPDRVIPLPQTVENSPTDLPKQPAGDDSDLEDPNVSREDFSIQTSEGENPSPPEEQEQSNAGSVRNPTKVSDSLRRSARFSSMSSLTTVSASVTPVSTTPGVDDESEVDRKPKREPKREPKLEDVFHLPSNVTALYLHSTKPFVISPAPITLEIPRAFLRLAYGGSDQHFVQKISAARNPGPSHTVIVNADGTETRIPKDERRIVFPMLNANPSMPRAPGAPGLVFASRHEILHDPPWTLFCKRESGKKAVWLYLGEYECELVGKLTPEQFKAQSTVVQHRWAELIITQQRQVCYMSMRARIVLRAANLIPIDNKEREEKLIKDEVEKIKHEKGKKVTTRQVLEAFSNGDEGVDIIRMKCVKYDHIFANDIVTRFEDYPDMIAADEAEKQKQERKPTRSASRSASTSARTSRRKQYYVDAASEDDDDEDEEDKEEDNSDGVDNRFSKKGKGKKMARATPTSKSKSKSAVTPSSRSKATGTPNSSTSGSARPRRRIGAPAVAVVDDIEDEADDNGGNSDDDYESEDVLEDDLSESNGA